MNTGRYNITKVDVSESSATTYITVHPNPVQDLEHISESNFKNMIFEQALGLNDPYKAVLEGKFFDICFYGSTPTNSSILLDLYNSEEYCNDEHLYEVAYAYPLDFRLGLLKGRELDSLYSPMYYVFRTYEGNNEIHYECGN